VGRPPHSGPLREAALPSLSSSRAHGHVLGAASCEPSARRDARERAVLEGRFEDAPVGMARRFRKTMKGLQGAGMFVPYYYYCIWTPHTVL